MRDQQRCSTIGVARPRWPETRGRAASFCHYAANASSFRTQDRYPGDPYPAAARGPATRTLLRGPVAQLVAQPVYTG